MEKRIKIIWILSLLSALLLIGVQGYWLFIQYQYTIDSYTEELGQEILQTAEKEFLKRKEEKGSLATFMFEANNSFDNTGDSIQQSKRITMAFALRDTFNTDGLSEDSIKSLRNKALSNELESLNDDPQKYYRERENIPEDTTGMQMRLSFTNEMAVDSLKMGMDRAVVNQTIPYKQERLDSILRADLPYLKYTILPWEFSNDTFNSIHSFWKQTDGFLDPQILVGYAYSPFERKGIYILADLSVQPVFRRMTIPLILSFGLILLLIGCLVFQIKTIMKQWRVGEMRQNFVNTMIHELKRPVQTLKTFVSFLGDKEMRSDETMTEQVVQDSMFELDNLSAYLNKLKDMMRADSHGTPLNLVKFDLQELVERVIRLTHIPTGKEVQFKTSFEMDSAMIEADPVHVANIISNLIENAVKYSGKTVEIEIKATRKGQELWLTVSDNGIGIPLTEQDKVFAKFYRGTNLPDQNIPGLGLGLSYVKLISEAHRGYISLQSHINEGTSVTLFLPQ